MSTLFKSLTKKKKKEKLNSKLSSSFKQLPSKHVNFKIPSPRIRRHTLSESKLTGVIINQKYEDSDVIHQIDNLNSNLRGYTIYINPNWSKYPFKNEKYGYLIKGFMTFPDISFYKHGYFDFEIRLEKYPKHPPKFKFLTKIYHPNVDLKSGYIDLSILSEDEWRNDIKLERVLIMIHQYISILKVRDTIYCMNMDAHHNLAVDPERFERIAREYTDRYALIKI